MVILDNNNYVSDVLKCCFCKKGGYTLTCNFSGCDVRFHLRCAKSKGIAGDWDFNTNNNINM
jgi:hypothetical protein